MCLSIRHFRLDHSTFLHSDSLRRRLRRVPVCVFILRRHIFTIFLVLLCYTRLKIFKACTRNIRITV